MQRRILDAGVRVLQIDGPLAFTTTRVAEEADISVGSLYQYFPNKQALALAIHDELVDDGLDHAGALLADPSLGRRDKLAAVVRWFFENETQEVKDLGTVVGDIEVFLGHPGARNDLEAAAQHAFVEAFGLALAEAQYAVAVIRSVGKSAASKQLTDALLRDWADRTATMLSDCFEFD